MQNYQTEAEKKRQFLEVCEKEVFPYLNDYEKERKKFRKEYYSRLLKICLQVIAGTVLLKILNNINIDILQLMIYYFFIFFYVYMLLVYFTLKYDAFCFVKNAKRKYIYKLLSVFGDLNWGTPSKCFFEKDIERCGLFTSYSTISNDDRIWGKYKNTEFDVSEICLSKIANFPRTNIPFFDAFSGIAILFNTGKKLKSKTIVVPKYDGILNINSCISDYIPALTCILVFICVWFLPQEEFIIVFIITIAYTCACWDEIKKPFKKVEMQKVSLEDVNFNKNYTAYSTSQVEGRCVLTTAFIDRMQNLKTAFSARRIKYSFFDDKLLVAISANKNLFEIFHFNKSFENKKVFLELYNQVNSIYEIIQCLKLDVRIGV